MLYTFTTETIDILRKSLNEISPIEHKLINVKKYVQYFINVLYPSLSVKDHILTNEEKNVLKHAKKAINRLEQKYFNYKDMRQKIYRISYELLYPQHKPHKSSCTFEFNYINKKIPVDTYI